jgi:hypothetical protein
MAVVMAAAHAETGEEVVAEAEVDIGETKAAAAVLTMTAVETLGATATTVVVNLCPLFPLAVAQCLTL